MTPCEGIKTESGQTDSKRPAYEARLRRLEDAVVDLALLATGAKGALGDVRPSAVEEARHRTSLFILATSAEQA
jgi:hypothetical protein